MNKYFITNEVNTKLIKGDDILWAGAGVVARMAPLVGAIPLVAILSTAVSLALAAKDNSITKITSVDQLRQFKNCITNEWKTKTIYIEHPHRKNVLIEAALYKDYILREMVADIANYITDHLDLSKLVIGLVSSSRANAKVNIPVQELNADATMKCNLDKNYIFSISDSHANPPENSSYVWISMFPDIISAVEHGSGKMEVRKTVTMDLDIHAGLGKAVGGVVGVKDKYEFYVTYVKQKNPM